MYKLRHVTKDWPFPFMTYMIHTRTEAIIMVDSTFPHTHTLSQEVSFETPLNRILRHFMQRLYNSCTITTSLITICASQTASPFQQTLELAQRSNSIKQTLADVMELNEQNSSSACFIIG